VPLGAVAAVVADDAVADGAAVAVVDVTRSPLVDIGVGGKRRVAFGLAA
jgi:hypothetical protein